MTKATNTTKQAKQASKTVLILTPAQHVAAGVACFRNWSEADGALQNAKALWDAARMELRTVLLAAHAQLTGKAWDTFKADLRAGLIAAKIVTDQKAAQYLVNNAVTALKITGKGAAKGGRKTKDATGEATNGTENAAGRHAAALAWLAEMQTKYVGEDDLLRDLGELAAILTATK